jgi:hypothetical protein
MKSTTDRRAEIDEQVAKREAEKAKERGDVIGLGDADPDVKLPGNIRRDGSHPAGIDVRDHASGIGDVSQTAGATGIDMGAGGSGTHVNADQEGTRRRKEKDEVTK